MRGRTLAGVVAASLAVVVIAGVAFATIPSADGTIHGCYKKTTKILRVINVEAGQKCRSDEYTLNWNQDGPAGAPGSPGPKGQPGEQGLPGTPSVSIVSSHANNFNISSDTYTYIDLFGGWWCGGGSASSRCEQAMPTDLVLANPHFRAYTVAGDISVQLLVNGTPTSLSCGLTFGTPSCDSSVEVALSEGDLVALAVFDADGGGDNAVDLRWTLEVKSAT